MRDFKIDNKGSAQIFHNPVLEYLTRTNFLFPVVFYYALAAINLAFAFNNQEIHFVHVLWIFPLAMIAFTLVEYAIHRFLFHFNATTDKQVELQYNIHGVHHEFPRDKDRLAMPPFVSIVLAAFFFFLFKILMEDYGMMFFAGFVSGYSTYLIIHYAVHALRPPKNFLKYWWRHHSHHHYSSVNTAYSVSFPIWDILFNTMPKAKGEEKRKIENSLPDRLR